MFTWRRAAAIAAAVVLAWTIPTSGIVGAAPPTRTFPGALPGPVAHGDAQRLGPHQATATIPFAVVLPLRNEANLDTFLQQVNDPSSPEYHQYLTQQQVNDLYDPTPDQEQAVASWLKSQGFQVNDGYANHLIVDATGTAAQIESAFNVSMGDYQATVNGKQRTFYSPDSAPTVTASVASDIAQIVGLTNYQQFAIAANGKTDGRAPYYPADFANAYDVTPLWNAGYTGSGQHIGITLWEAPPSSSTLSSWASTTGASNPYSHLNVIKVDGGNGIADDGEASLDVEYTSGMAPAAAIDFYEAPSSGGNPTSQGLIDALNLAGTDSNNNQEISSSWGGCEDSSYDSWEQALTSVFKSNSATGHNYFFSSGDSSSSCGGSNPYPTDPANNPYVTSVGGTTFSGNVTT